MRNAILLHWLTYEHEYYDPDYPAGSDANWFPWLQKRLMMNDIKADTPEVPRPFDFDYASWVREVERFDITRETTLVGQSMGGGFWVRYLSEHPELEVDRVILVAPWLNVHHEEPTDFFDFEIDPGIVRRARNGFSVFTSDNDRYEALDSAAMLRERLPEATVRVFPGHGHFALKDLGTEEFPALLEAILAPEESNG